MTELVYHFELTLRPEVAQGCVAGMPTDEDMLQAVRGGLRVLTTGMQFRSGGQGTVSEGDRRTCVRRDHPLS